MPNEVLFVFHDAAPAEIYTLSLHDALPISDRDVPRRRVRRGGVGDELCRRRGGTEDLGKGAPRDRKSTRLNSSHGYISYAVFCLKKKTMSFFWISYI